MFESIERIISSDVPTSMGVYFMTTILGAIAIVIFIVGSVLIFRQSNKNRRDL